MKYQLLASGILAGLLFVAVSLLQAFTRVGFDLRRHPLSLLSSRGLGWIQIADFAVAGAGFENPDSATRLGQLSRGQSNGVMLFQHLCRSGAEEATLFDRPVVITDEFSAGLRLSR